MKKSTLILIINVSVLALIILIGLATQVAPYLTCSLLALAAITLLYILTEQWMTHDAVEFENRFWTSMAFALASACFFCVDSPMHLGDKPGVAWFIIVIFTFLAHNYDRHLQRLILIKTTNMRRIRSQDFCAEHRSNAQEKVVELRKLLSTIDHTWMSSTFLNFFFLYGVLKVERQIITILSEANADELNLILNNIELALLFYKMKDHKIARSFNRTNLLKLLCVDRVSELVIPSRVVLLDSLQRMKLSAHPQSEQFVMNIIFSTKIDDLSDLKTLMDNKGDINNMHKLLYSDIRNPETKESILKYIAHQADVQRAHSKIGSKKSKQLGLLAWRKILSDVDDTLCCAGGSWPAGMDNSYPKKAIYPGVLAFYRELDLGTVGANEWDRTTRVGNLAFLSARPHVYKSVSENVSYSKFKTLQQERGLYTSPTLLAGSLDTGGQFMVKGDAEPLALKKFENFREYLTLYPEYSCIFIGDNGQGDVRTAELVLQDSTFSSNLQRVYIHQVQPRHLTYCKNGDRTLDNDRVYFFGTYVDAAIDAYKHNLIRLNGLRNIMEEACEDFLLIPESAWLPSHSSKSSKSNVSATAVPGGISAPGTPNRGRSPSFGGVEASGVSMSPNSSPAALAAGAGVRRDFPSGLSSGGSGGSPAPLRQQPTGSAVSIVPRGGSGKTSKDRMLSSTGSLGVGSAGNSAGSLSGGRESPSIPLLSRSFLGKQLSQFNIKKLRTGALPGEGLTPASMGYCRGGGIVRVKSTSAAEVVMAERKRELRLREINNDLVKGNAILCSEGAQQVDYLAFPCRYEVGTAVMTMFGEGVITRFRSDDGIYEVLIPWEWRREGSDSMGSAEAATGKTTSAKGIAIGVMGGTVGAQLKRVEEGEEVWDSEGQNRRRSVHDDEESGSGGGMVEADQLPDEEFQSPRRGGISVFIAGVAIHTQY